MRRILSETVLKIGSKEIPVNSGRINGQELMQALKDAGVECEGDMIEVEVGIPDAGMLPGGDMPPGQEVMPVGPESGPPPLPGEGAEGAESEEASEKEEKETEAPKPPKSEKEDEDGDGEGEDEKEEKEEKGEKEEGGGNPFAEAKKRKKDKSKKDMCEGVKEIADSMEESIIERVY